MSKVETFNGKIQKQSLVVEHQKSMELVMSKVETFNGKIQKNTETESSR